ncbi:MAG: site-specific integrase [Bacteroidetes bacterium]|nr:site-specific integrase [Bacteroidota bacterium]
METTHTKILIDTRRAVKSGLYPVKLRITYNRVQKYFPVLNEDKTKLEMNEEYFNHIRTTAKPRKDEKKIIDYLKGYEAQAQDVIKDLPFFSFDRFEKLFYSQTGDNDNIFTAFEKKIKKVNDEGRAGTANSYHDSMNSLKTYYKKSILNFSDITPEFLKGYEREMTKGGKSLTTVGIYLRCVRALFNDLLSETTDKKYIYPFGKNKYIIPSGQNIKKALSLPDIKKIFDYKAAAETPEAWTRDIWVFSYLCNGINIADIARLRYKDIKKDSVYFRRKKTMNTGKANMKDISAPLTDEALRIIDRRGTKPQEPETYVFSILTPGLTPQAELAKVKQATKNINNHMKIIAAAVGINENVTTYTARHSYATVLKRSGVSIEYISESLGHSDMKVTENYLSSFETEKKREIAKKLTEF